MNKFNELLKLNNDIKLLEANGNFVAANILSQKFFKKAEEKEKKFNEDNFNQINDYMLNIKNWDEPVGSDTASQLITPIRNIGNKITENK